MPSTHDWKAIGHIGDGNEYLVWICQKCAKRATVPDYHSRKIPPEASKYGPCGAEPETKRTAWDIIGGEDGGL